nr:reverse transcriptase domain-containing protein [Tanacetum cinerariifolium]
MDRFNDLLRACPHHGFSELHQLDTFYNALNVNDQDSLNSAADKKNQSSAPAPSPTPAPVKAVEHNCITCGGIVEPLRIELLFLEDQFQEDPPVDPPEVSMADNRTMAELLQAPTEGYEDVIVIPEIAANNFELKHVVAKVSTSSSTPAVSSKVSELKDMVRALLLDKKNQSSAPASSSTPAPVKAIEPNYVTCGGAHSYQNCHATSGNVYRDNIQECFLNTGRALIDVHKGELTLRIENEAITYNLDQTVRYSANYNQMTANKINVICEMYSQEVLSFSDVTASGNPTPYDDPIVSTTSPTLTPFGDSDFLLFKEANAFLGLEDDPN